MMDKRMKQLTTKLINPTSRVISKKCNKKPPRCNSTTFVGQSSFHYRYHHYCNFIRNNTRCTTSFLNQKQQQYASFSSTTKSSSSKTTTAAAASPSQSKNNPKIQDIKLKQLIRPFLLTYHPDRSIMLNHQNTNDNSNNMNHHNQTEIAKEVNLKAIQTLNGMIDTIDQIYNRAINSNKNQIIFNSNQNNNQRIQLQSKYTIEFLVPSTTDSQNYNDYNLFLHNDKLSKKQKEAISTRRSVDLTFTSTDQSIIQSIDSKTGSYSILAANMVKLKAIKHVAKLLRVAKLNVPDYIDDYNLHSVENDIKNDIVYNKDKMDVHDQLILDELELDNDYYDIGGSNRTFDRRRQQQQQQQQQQQTRRPKTEYEKSRDRFMQQVDWKEHARLYDEAMEDMKRDLATEGLIKMNEERKQRFVADIISRVRIYEEEEEVDDDSTIHDGDDDDEQNSKVPSVDPLQQLIAIRRMSLLFTDNFEELEMEEMGKMWSQLSIILTPERKKGSGEKGAPFSRRKRLREGKESGFKFSFHDEGQLSVHVPIDFLDDELVGELKRHLSDFYDLCVGDVMAQFFPKNYNQFGGHPRIE